MSRYEVQLSKPASKQLKKLPVQARERIQAKIDKLADNPRPPGVVKLEDSDNGYRIRVGTYRVLYDIFDDVLYINVVRVGHRKEVYRDEGSGSSVPLHCLVMEKIQGVDLQQWMVLRHYQPISQQKTLHWLRQLVCILDLVHAKQYFHRDIKPHNIMLRRSGKLVLIDFGAVRQVTTTILAGDCHTKIFSEGYSPPEQQNGYSMPQSDFFALGRTFVFLVTSSVLFLNTQFLSSSADCKLEIQAVVNNNNGTARIITFKLGQESIDNLRSKF